MEYNTRILIVDDNRSIHDDFKKVLDNEQESKHEELDNLETELFGSAEDTTNPAEKPLVDNKVKYTLDSAYQGQEALELVAKADEEGRPYTMCFMDVRMPPGWDGVETIIHIWEKYPYVEMVLCTAYSDYSWAEIIERLGNTDKLLFIRKPFDSIAVQQTALTLVKKWNLGEESRRYVNQLEEEVANRTMQLKELLDEIEVKNNMLTISNDALEHASLHDPLTLLPNRALFNDRLESLIKMTGRGAINFAVGMVNVDNFKNINDQHGHVVGDKVLKEIGTRMQLVLRSSDTVARIGGDEFAILIPSVNQEITIPVLAKFSSVMDAPIIVDDLCISVGISLGLGFYPEHGADAETLLTNANNAMYYAKTKGWTYYIFDPQEKSTLDDAEQLIHDLEDAIENNGLSLHYQPIIDLETGQIASLEALCRWTHPSRGEIYPDQFIPIAEQKGLIQKLTTWVIEESLKQVSIWKDELGVELGLSINLSVRNFLDPLLPKQLQQALERNNVKAELITLEITESMMMSDPQRALVIVQTFNDMNVSLSIDDFGTGYSSLSYLKQLAVQELKIDRSFIMDMDSNIDDRIIVKSTIELAHNLNRTVVAEGVENENILFVLKELGVDKVQGYHLCKPKSANDLAEWFKVTDWTQSEAG